MYNGHNKETTMRINKKNSTITLGRGERAKWGARSADARDLAEVNRRIALAAHALAVRTGRDVEIYAPAEAGGQVVDVYERPHPDAP